MAVAKRVGGSIVGAAFGAGYAWLKSAGMTDVQLVAELYRTVPTVYLLVAGAVVFAVAGFNLTRYLPLVAVVCVFGAFFVFEFALPPGSDTLLKYVYLTYLAGGLLLLLPSLRVFVPTTPFPFVR